jgi:hypothetical protein
MLSHFRIIPFLLGIVAAALIFLIYRPQKQVIHQYPHPNDVKGNVYKDPNGTCYSYTAHAVDCDANEATLKEYPIQG